MRTCNRVPERIAGLFTYILSSPWYVEPGQCMLAACETNNKQVLL